MARHRTALPLALIHFRLAHAIDVMLRSLAHGPAPSGGGLEAHVTALLDFLTGALEAPFSEESS